MSLSDFTYEGNFSSEDAKELSVLLGNKSMRKAIGVVLTKANSMDKLSSYTLDGQEGLSKALKAQGTVQGMKLALEEIIDLAQLEEEEDV